ncbi:hypothetical protein RhiirA4_454461 [Rhizophagus irregularis]|uniref:Uncharacterized protein n=1 Tax=Rhizophagus irregularis TaxID=588596 RepID=A0A2I1G2V9_9GLOM|nr:hypothetical protein RhiirA4_454461 [Rhizophagus irregularis]
MFICENNIECANKYLNECIAKIAKRRIAYSNPIQKNVKKRVSSELSDNEVNEIYMKNDGTPDEKKFLSIIPCKIKVSDN